MTLKKHTAFLLAVGMIGLGAGCAAAEPVVAIGTATLRQCYLWAMDRSEDLKIQHEEVNQSKARARAALGSALPYADWEFTDTWQDPKGVDELDQQGFAGFVEKEQVESKLSLRQPLFSGFREFSAWSGFKRENARDRFLLERASLELFERTANSFYAVVDNETTWQNTYAAWSLAEDRVKELKGFLRLGKSRDSELFTAQAHSAALKAKLDEIAADINASREELSFLTGKDLAGVPLADELSSTPTVGSLDDTLSRAHARTDIRAQREEVAARKLQIRYERGSYWPNADVTGNYYLRRPAYLDPINWDVILALKVPFFQGGQVAARVDAATSVYIQSQQRLEEMERTVVYSVRRIYGDLVAAMREAQSLDEAASAAQKSYDALRKEYRYGLVTNLDVLEALDFLQSQKSARDSIRLKVKRLYIQLNVALEQMPI